MKESTPGAAEEPADAARAQLALLAAAGSYVLLGPTGYAARVSPECEAYDALCEALPVLARLEPELMRMVREGEPAAILYAALLLRKLGHDVRPLLLPYLEDDRVCRVNTGGCSPLPIDSLADAARWLLGEPMRPTPPARLIADALSRIERAQWFALPTQATLQAAAQGRMPERERRDHTFEFAKLAVGPLAPQLASCRAAISAQLGAGSIVMRLYAALLLRQIDPVAGDQALCALAKNSHERVPRAPFWFGLRRSYALPRLIAELRAWSAG